MITNWTALHPDYPGIHKRYLTAHERRQGDSIPNRAACSAPRCAVVIRDYFGVCATCCNLDCPHHYPNDYRGRHRA